MSELLSQVTEIIVRVGNLPAASVDEDIYEAGFSSVRSLELLIELETAFAVSLPDDEFVEARTPSAVAALISRCQSRGDQ